MRVLFIHGACVRDGAWWWSRVANLLRAGGVESTAARLPSCGETSQAPGTDGPGFDDDVEEVRRVLAEPGRGAPGDDPWIIVGHSYGGVVATEAADGASAVSNLVYISSFLPDVGESLSTFGGSQPAPYLDFAADGTFGARCETLRELFLYDCDESAVDGGLARLTRQSVAVTTQPVRQAAWRRIPTTYMVCAGDRATPPALQRAQGARADRVVDLPTGHHPFLSHPDVLAQAIRDVF